MEESNKDQLPSEDPLDPHSLKKEDSIFPPEGQGAVSSPSSNLSNTQKKWVGPALGDTYDIPNPSQIPSQNKVDTGKVTLDIAPPGFPNRSRTDTGQVTLDMPPPKNLSNQTNQVTPSIQKKSGMGMLGEQTIDVPPPSSKPKLTTNPFQWNKTTSNSPQSHLAGLGVLGGGIDTIDVPPPSQKNLQVGESTQFVTPSEAPSSPSPSAAPKLGDKTIDMEPPSEYSSVPDESLAWQETQLISDTPSQEKTTPESFAPNPTILETTSDLPSNEAEPYRESNIAPSEPPTTNTVPIERRGEETLIQPNNNMVSLHPVEKEFIGEYQVIRKLGEGGMGTVYKCVDPTLRRNVALKMLHTQFSRDPKFRARFEIEAQTVARLRHPNIIQVFRAGEDPKRRCLFIAMDFIEGKTLEEMIEEKGGGLSVKEVLFYLEQVTEGLQYSHKKNILHRDIKPANIMVSNENVAMLADFGLAKIVGQSDSSLEGGQASSLDPENAALTQQGSIVGTPFYLSPERIQGVNDDPRADIYALGMVLYHCLTGVPPFKRNTIAEILAAQQFEEPVPLETMVPRCPPEVVELFRKATQKNPDNRYQTVGEFLEQLVYIRTHKEKQKILEEKKKISQDMAIALTATMPKSSARSSQFGKRLGSILALLGIVAVFALLYSSGDLGKPKKGENHLRDQGSREGDFAWVDGQNTRVAGLYLRTEETKDGGVYMILNANPLSENVLENEEREIYFPKGVWGEIKSKCSKQMKNEEFIAFQGRAMVSEEYYYIQGDKKSYIELHPIKGLHLGASKTEKISQLSDFKNFLGKTVSVSGTILYIYEAENSTLELMIGDDLGNRLWFIATETVLADAEKISFSPRLGDYVYGIGNLVESELGGKNYYYVEIDEGKVDAFAYQK